LNDKPRREQTEAEAAAEARQDEETAEAVVAAVEAAQRRRRLFSVPQENVIAAAALILSLVMAIINAYYAMRGPEVVVQAPDQVILYRDGEGQNAVLTIAAPLMMINAASAEHGDVLVEAMLQLGESEARYKYQTLAQPIFTEDPGARDKCEVGMRCIVFEDLVVVERNDEIVDIPGGSAKWRYLTFHLVPFTCDGPKAACARYPDFARAVAALEGKPLEMEIVLGFHSDGERRIRCGVPKADLSYLKEVGWTALPCATSSVKGDRLL